ncbi:hypothetical protein LTR09_012338 [Extremus antarcticus]|uniref:Uncharacterized protein n=1 Tax=Extremus antarcticus TaxID=702011 RepID=A0AAJ0G3W0_9PEZI|nr:hypothetical protein LTR09_012338 [Extremus antarcticus]
MPELIWLITGCSSGLGEALTQAVLARGDKVIATARSPVDRLKKLENAGAAVLELDVTATPAALGAVVEKALEIYGAIDVLVPNAGYGEMIYAEEATSDIWTRQLTVNFYGVTNLVASLLPHFRSRKTGTIAFMNSIYAHVSTPAGGPYAVSKHAIAAYSKTLAAEIGEFGIKPIIFDMGFIRTDS